MELPDVEFAALTRSLPYRTPFDWAGILRFFGPRAIPGVESVSGDIYRRTVQVGGRQGVIEIRPARRSGCLSLTLHGLAPGAEPEVTARARQLFDLDAPIEEIARPLRRDESLKRLMAKHTGIRVPGAWNGFETTVRAILGQQVSVKAATTLAGRIAERYGEPLRLGDGVADPLRPGGDVADPVLRYLFPSPERLMRAQFRNVGLVRSRAETIRRVASAVVRNELNFDPAQDPLGFCRSFCTIRGIGDWTAQYVAMRVLKYPDAWPATDLGLLKALKHPERMGHREMSERAEAWRPWRAYAAMLLWSSSGTSVLSHK